jgi:predicted PurR-regulated permease PerM
MIPEDSKTEPYRRAAIIFAAVIGGVLVTAIVFFLIYQISGALLPFVYALIIVYLLRPLVNLMVMRNIPRIVAVSTIYLLLLLLITLMLIFLVPNLIAQISEFILDFPDYVRAGLDYFAQLRIAFLRIDLPQGAEGLLDELSERTRATALAIAAGLPQRMVGFLGGLLNLILGPIIAFYILKDLPAIKETLFGLVPEGRRKETMHIVKELDYAVRSYIKGQLLIAFIVGAAVAIYLAVIGVNFALLLGVIAGILNVVPYFGAIAGGALATIVALFESPRLALLVVIGITVIQQIESAVISPTVMRHAVQLHPSLIILSLLIGGTLFGFLGLILSIPVAAIAKALFLHYVYNEHVLEEV